MAVAELKAVNIVGKLDILDDVVIACGSSDVFQVDDASKFYSENKRFLPLTDKNPYTELLAKFDEALSCADIALDQVSTNNKSMSYTELAEYTDKIYNGLTELTKAKDACLAEITQCEQNITNTSHFLGFNLEMDKISACKYIKTNFGRLPTDGFKKLSMYEDNPYVMFIPCTRDATHYWGVYISPVEYSSDVDRIFSGLFFEPFEISGMDNSTPEKYCETLKKQLAELKENYKQVCDKLNDFIAANKEMMTVAHSKIFELNTYFGMKSYVINHDGTFIFAGWIPAKQEKEFKDRLSKIEGIECTITSPKDNKRLNPPVKLKNSRFFRPFEFYVDMYGLPDYNEIDPTPFVAITYSLLFGVMFGDLGQGIVLSIVGLFMFHVMGMKLGRIIARCGIFSAFFGVVFGSVFGFEHALDGFYKMLGFSEKPIEVMDSNVTNMIIYAAVGAGIVLLLISMLLNIYSSFTRRDYEQGIFGPNGIAGFVFYGSLVFGLVNTLLFDNNIMNRAYVIFLIILPLFLILLKEPLGKLCAREENWQPESWGGYIVQNVFELFETVLSYVTNTMSFLRVGAFVLVHAGMMMVVFTLADMTSGIAYLIILIVGNIIVIALEGLLVGIQVLRLEFYEMFSRFYNGQGRAFTPVHVEITDKKLSKVKQN